MVAVRSPLIGLKMDADVAAYVGALERQIAALSINEVKFRALLEVLTGEEWDDMKTEFENKEIYDIGVRIAETKLGMKAGEARKWVSGRMDASRAASEIS